MGSLSAAAVLRLPVRLHGVRIGRPVDLLLEPETRRAVGFVVLCGDAAHRFLAYAAGRPDEAEIAVDSSLLLLDDVGFYRARSQSLRELLGAEVTCERRPAGVLRDVLLGPGGAAEGLEVERDGVRTRVEASCAVVSPARAPAA